MRFGRVFSAFLIGSAFFLAQTVSAASYSLVPSEGTRVSGSDRSLTISAPSPLSMPLNVKVKHTKDGKVSGYELSRPARIGVQSEFANYLDGGPWEQTRMQLVRSLGKKSLEFVILERPILIEAVNSGAIDMAVTDAGNFIQFEMTGQLIGLSSLWPVSASDPSYADGVLFVKRAQSKEIRRLSDIRNRRIAADYPTSFGGWLIALREFQKHGLNTDVILDNVRFYGTDPANILRSLQQEKVDLAVLPTCTFESLAKRGVIDENDFAFVDVNETEYSVCRHSGELYPSFIISMLSGTDSLLSRTVMTSLQQMTGASTGVDWGPVASVRTVHDLYYALKVGPYEHLQAFRLSTFIREQSAGVTITLGVVFLVLFYAGSLSVLVRRRTALLNRALEDRKRIEAEAAASRDHIAHLERTGIVGQMSTMIAHELKQPLGAITNFANGLLRRLKRGAIDPKVFSEALEEIVMQGTRASEIVNRVRSYAKQQQPVLELSDMQEIVCNAISTFERSRRSSAKIEADLQPFLWADIDAWEIELAILNLLKNAADSVEGLSDAKILVRVRAEDRYWRVEVIDNGPKITQEEVDRFMMPLVTSKAGGLGLGLSICSNIAERHHGHISGYANPDGGVTIAMDIPRAALPEHTAM